MSLRTDRTCFLVKVVAAAELESASKSASEKPHPGNIVWSLRNCRFGDKRKMRRHGGNRSRLVGVTVGALAIVVTDWIIFIVGFATCSESGCGDKHRWVNGITAYIGIGLSVVCFVLVVVTVSNALFKRRT